MISLKIYLKKKNLVLLKILFLPIRRFLCLETLQTEFYSALLSSTQNNHRVMDLGQLIQQLKQCAAEVPFIKGYFVSGEGI